MKFSIPGLCFLTSSTPLEFNTDGHITRFETTDQRDNNAGQVLVITSLHVPLFNLKSIPAISLFDTIDLPDNFHVPAIYDGFHDLHNKNILIMMLNGWGDMILIQPALRALYRTVSHCFQAMGVHQVLQALEEITSRCLGYEKSNAVRNKACVF